MADADTRAKRQSATCMLVPSLLSGVYPSTSGVVQAEWQAIAWMYSGIKAGEAVTWGTDIILRGVNAITGEYVYIIGQYKEP